MSILRNVVGVTGLVLSLATQADIIYLNNGDKISGTITEMEANTVSIDIDYAEEKIVIDWKDISNLETGDEVTILKSDSTRAKGRIESARNGDITLGGPTGTTLRLDDITNINPVPEGTYVGEGIFDLGGLISAGNTKNGSLHAAAEYIYRNEVNRFTMGGTYDLARNSSNGEPSKESANNFRFYGQFDRFLDANWYVYANADFTKDRFQDLDFRITGGAGLGYQFWDDSDKFLSLEAGPGYTYEVYTSEEKFNRLDDNTITYADGILEGQAIDILGSGAHQTSADTYSRDLEDKRSYVNARWALDFHHWFLDESLQLFHDHEGIISLEQASDLLIRTHTGVRVPVFNGFDVIAQFDYDWKNIPASGKRREDFRYILGVGYTW
ncbi:MAG: DUF481 domain-containing protein [Methylococcaceae bacterium]